MRVGINEPSYRNPLVIVMIVAGAADTLGNKYRAVTIGKASCVSVAINNKVIIRYMGEARDGDEAMMKPRRSLKNVIEDSLSSEDD